MLAVSLSYSGIISVSYTIDSGFKYSNPFDLPFLLLNSVKKLRKTTLDIY